MIHQSSGYTITLITAERFRLDGGAMFGSVPKVLWDKRIAGDEANRIQMCCNVLLLEGHGRRILVDLGMGRKWSEKEQAIYAIEYSSDGPLEILAPNVTDLLLTHLHFDHVGGISRRNANGTLEPAFPGAKLLLSARNYEHARNCGVRERASYIPENVDLVEVYDYRLTHHGEEVLPNIRVYYSNGHTHGLQWILIGKGEGAMAFPSDLIPMSHHLPIPYVMGYDLNAETAMREKAEFLKLALSQNWIVVFEHDPVVPVATLIEEKGRAAIGKQVVLPRINAFPA